MSWVATFWDLDHIVESARRAMEVAYFAEQEQLTPAAPNSDNVQFPEQDPLAQATIALEHTADLPFSASAAITGSQDLAISVKKEAVIAKEPTRLIPFVSPWTADIEAALRAFLKPLSAGVRYDYQFLDMLNERASIETINGLFKESRKKNEPEGYEIAEREIVRRRRASDVRRDKPFDQIGRRA